MNPLRQRFIDDMRLRNLSLQTIEVCVHGVAKYAKHFGRSIAVIIACVTALTLATGRALADDVAKAGTEWVGTHQRAQQPVYKTDARLAIVKRDGENFIGEYWLDNGKLGMQVEGSIAKGGVVIFTVTKEIKGDLPKDLVGNAKFNGRIDGKQISGTIVVPSARTATVKLAAQDNPNAVATAPPNKKAELTPKVRQPLPLPSVAEGTKPDPKKDASFKYTLYLSLKPTNTKQAMECLLDSAGKGYAQAQNDLGECYLKGDGITRDVQLAVRWFQMAADQNNAAGQYNLSCCYAAGIGVLKSDREAYRLELKAAELDHGKAQAKIAARYFGGMGVAKNPDEGLKWLKKSSARGENWANTLYGMIHLSGTGVKKDPAEAVTWFRKAADNDDPIAQFYLGCCYQRGTGTPIDSAAAKQWFTKSAKAGYAPAKVQLGAKDAEQSAKALIVLVALAAAMDGNGGNSGAVANLACNGGGVLFPCSCRGFEPGGLKDNPDPFTCRRCLHAKNEH